MAKAPSFSGDILHFNAARLRITGSGTMRMTLSSLDDVNQFDLQDLTMQATTNREPTVLANYIDQRGRLEGYTQDIDETFTISRIVIFIKPIASSYPQ